MEEPTEEIDWEIFLALNDGEPSNEAPAAPAGPAALAAVAKKFERWRDSEHPWPHLHRNALALSMCEVLRRPDHSVHEAFLPIRVM